MKDALGHGSNPRGGDAAHQQGVAKVGQPRTFYRGEDPGDTRRITTGNATWDSHFFVSSNPHAASMYGSQVSRYEATPDARILYEGTKDFRQVAGQWRKSENLLQYSDRAAQAAKAAGYHAVHFQRQGDVGTAVFDRSKFRKV